MKKATILLPTFNERRSVEKFIEEVFSQEKNTPGWSFEVIVADDVRSTDGTEELIKKLAQKNKHLHLIKVEPGLGVGQITGHQYALKNHKPDALVQLDADGQVASDVIPRLLGALDEGYTLAIGSRFVKGGKNLLSPSRRLFSWGSSIFCRIVMGPFDIKEYSNSARAFTPELFQRIDLTKLPWQEKTFIVQPAFLYAAIQVGAKYKEVPLVFKNRAEGYSKMKVVNYIYDVVTFALDARMHKMGINIPFFRMTRGGLTFVKFAIVGFSGTIVDFLFYKLFIAGLGLPPATAKAFSSEIGVINNFTFNNFWTFRARKTKTNVFQKFIIYNLVSLGGIAIAVVIVKFLHSVYGDGVFHFGPLQFEYNTLYFLATIPPVMVWNFTINHLVTWRHKED